MAASETQVVAGIGNDYKFGFSDPENYFFKSQRGLARDRRGDLSAQGRAAVDAGLPPQVARVLRGAPDAVLGRRPLRHRLREHLLLHQADREPGEVLGRPPPDIKQTWDRLGIRGRAQVPRRRRRPVRVGGRLPQAPGRPRGEGRALPGHGLGPARAEELVRQYFGTIIPQNDNKFALNSAVWSAAPSSTCPRASPSRCRSRLLPHQRENMSQFERTLIIVDEGAYVHYVEGCTAPIYTTDSPLRPSSRSSSSLVGAAGTRRSRTGRTTSTTSSRSARSPTRTRPWSGWTGTSARSRR